MKLIPYSQRETDIGPMMSIGTIHTPFKTPKGMPIQGALSGNEEGEITIKPAFQKGLLDLDGFSHIVLLYALHRMEGFRLVVTPYLDDRERGIFATRSPSRPNPIGMTVVRLVEIDGCRLNISGVDMLDGTPLLDIKPSIPVFDHPEHTRCGWFEPHLKRLKQEKVIPVADSRFHNDDDQKP